MSFLLRDHANLLCNVKRLFDAQSKDWADTKNGFEIYKPKEINFISITNQFNFHSASGNNNQPRRQWQKRKVTKLSHGAKETQKKILKRKHLFLYPFFLFSFPRSFAQIHTSIFFESPNFFSLLLSWMVKKKEVRPIQFFFLFLILSRKEWGGKAVT